MSGESVATTIGASSGLMSLLPMVFIFAIFYFFLIRPQVKRQRQTEQMINELKKGDKVVAAGGLYGTIAKIEDNVVFLEIAEGIKIKALKTSVTEAISANIPKEETKASTSKTNSKSQPSKPKKVAKNK